VKYLVFALVVMAAVGSAVLGRHVRRSGRPIDPGTVSQQWLADSRREEEA